MKPPLTLNYHFFPRIQVVADSSISRTVKKASEFGYKFSTVTELRQSQDNPLEYQLQLTIHSDSAEGKIKGYDITLDVVGFIEADRDYPEEQRDGMISVVGASLLYGAARDFLYTITSRGPFPAVYLPTISFMPDDNGSGHPEVSEQS